jgi:hypothetical protein
MNRDELINLIFAIKAEAIQAGFDWPTNDTVTNETTDELREFYYEVLRFLENRD